MAETRNIMLLRQRPEQVGYGFMSLYKMNGSDTERANALNEARRALMGWQTTLPQDTFVLAYTDLVGNREVMNQDGFRGQLDFVR